MKTSWMSLLVVGCLAFALPGRATADTTLVDQNFDTVNNTTVTLTSVGWYSFNTGGTAQPWTGASLTSGSLSGEVLRNPEGNAANTLALTQWSAVTLGVGDSLQVSLNMVTSASLTNSGMSIDLLGGVAAVSGNDIGNGATPFLGATGYAFNESSYSASGVSLRSIFGAIAGNGLANGTYVNGGGATVTDSQSETSATAPALGNASAHAVVFTLTRESTGMLLSTSVDGNAYSTYLDTNVVVTNFNTLVLNASNGGGGSPVVSFDNVNVTLIPAPEPPAAAMIGAALLLLLAGGIRASRRAAAAR